MRIATVFIAVALLAGADDPKRDGEAASELLGTWIGKTSVSSGGDFMLQTIWEISEDKIVSIPRLNEPNITREAKYRHDPAKNPKEFDRTLSVGPGAGKTMKGIYKIENDTLTICCVRPTVDGAETRARPTEFEAKTRDDVVILTFQRKRP